MISRRQVQVITWRWHDGAREYLLLGRTPGDGGFWQAITGGIDPGETAEQTASREFLEETGLSGRPVPTGIRHTFHWVGLTFEEVIFACEVSDAGATVTLGPDHDRYRWSRLGEALWSLFWPANRQHLLEVDRILQESSTKPPG